MEKTEQSNCKIESRSFYLDYNTKKKNFKYLHKPAFLLSTEVTPTDASWHYEVLLFIEYQG